MHKKKAMVRLKRTGIANRLIVRNSKVYASTLDHGNINGLFAYRDIEPATGCCPPVAWRVRPLALRVCPNRDERTPRGFAFCLTRVCAGVFFLETSLFAHRGFYRRYWETSSLACQHSSVPPLSGHFSQARWPERGGLKFNGAHLRAARNGLERTRCGAEAQI